MKDHLEIFLRAMASGYATSPAKSTIAELPGSKTVTWVYDNDRLGIHWRVVDCWFSNAQRSSGFTTMWLNDQAVWMMQYGGWYAAEALPFLKECLRRAYVTERKFYGGRGPAFVRGERFTYVNKHYGTISEFDGEEGIFDADGGRCSGFHWYRGMSLADA